MNPIEFVRKVPNTINGLFLASLVFLVAKLLYFNHVNEYFSNAHDIGVLFESIFTSIIASYAFCLIVVHRVDIRNKSLTNPIVKKWAGCVAGDGISLITEIFKSNNLTMENLTKENLKNSLFHLTPNNPSSNAGEY